MDQKKFVFKIPKLSIVFFTAFVGMVMGKVSHYQMQEAFSEMDEDIGWNDFDLPNYDPQIGRWVQQDPLDDYIGSPYTGMGNDPVNIVDPSGGDLLPIHILMNFGTAVGTASNAASVASTAVNVASKGANLFGIIKRLLAWC